MRVVVAHPTGNEVVRALTEALLEAGLLVEFNTALAINSEGLWLKVLPVRQRQQLLRRTFKVPAKQTQTHPTQEMLRMLLHYVGLGSHTRDVYRVYRHFDLAVARRLGTLHKQHPLDAVYAYEDGALETFTQAKARGIRCIYDLPIAYWETGRQLMLAEAERLPQWAATLGGGIHDSAAKLARKAQELELADVVVVPSSFVRDSLPAWAAAKPTEIVPFGRPAALTTPAAPPKPVGQRPLRVLFVGGLGQRKGLGDLFAAVRLLNRADLELVVLGTPLAPHQFYQQLLPNFTYEPNRPHDQVLALMRTCDVFCLPSIVEGRALVMQEAMSQGLPLIITPNTGGEDLIREGETGFLVPIRSPEAIAEKLTWFLDHRAQLPEMSQLARAHAATYTWQRYGADILAALAEPVY